MYIFMIVCYLLMVLNLINILICGLMGYFNFSFLGANHAQFGLFSILIFVLTETLVMYFFIATGKSIKTILSQEKDNTAHELWEKIIYIKKIIFPHIMLTITLIGGLYIFYFGYIKSNIMNESTPYYWIQAPLFLIALIHHIWSLKVKNDSFRLQIEVVNKLSKNTPK